MYHLRPIKNFHAPHFHVSDRFNRIIHDERFQAVVVAAILLAIIAFAIWLGSLGY